MKLLGALLTLTLALMIEVVAGYFSVIGLAALFAAAFWPVVIMGGTLEAGKLVAASWLKSNLKNPNVGWWHKFYLFLAILSLMAITSLGIYGYLAKAHLEQEANLPAIEMKIKQSEARIAQADAERLRQEARLTQLDQSVSVMLANSKTVKDARGANLARDAQRRDRVDIQKQIVALNKEVNGLNDALVPLRLQVSDVSAKLGPVKYVANLFGWHDPNSAVQLIIGLIMIAFDPLAVVMVLSGTMSLSEALKEMAERRAARRAVKSGTPLPQPVAKPPTAPLDKPKARATKPDFDITTLMEKIESARKPSKALEVPLLDIGPDSTATEIPAMRKPSKPIPVFAFDPNEATESHPPAPVIVTTTVDAKQLQQAHEDNFRLTRQLAEQTATFDALQAEIARLKAMPEKEKLTTEPKSEIINAEEVPSFNAFSDSRLNNTRL